MKKIISLIAMLFVYLLPALSTPAYGESHGKVESAKTDAEKKKIEGEEEDEEPECD